MAGCSLFQSEGIDGDVHPFALRLLVLLPEFVLNVGLNCLCLRLILLHLRPLQRHRRSPLDPLSDRGGLFGLQLDLRLS